MTEYSHPSDTAQGGLSIEDAQYMICQGAYGGKVRSVSERQAACQRYEELSGRPAPFPILDVVLVVLAVAVISSIVYACMKKEKPRKIKSTSKQKRN